MYNHLDVIIVILLKINYRPNHVSDVLVASAREAIGEDHATAWLLSVLDQYHVEERGDAET